METGVHTIPAVPAGTAAGIGVRTLPAARTRSKRASRNMFLTAAALVAAVFLLVGLSAYAASIQHANNVLAEENTLDEKGKVDPLKLNAILFDQLRNGYYRIGGKAGQAWNAGAALMKGKNA